MGMTMFDLGFEMTPDQLSVLQSVFDHPTGTIEFDFGLEMIQCEKKQDSHLASHLVSLAAQNWEAMENSVIGLEKPRAAPPGHQLSALQLV
jgi:hypothetical protein